MLKKIVLLFALIPCMVCATDKMKTKGALPKQTLKEQLTQTQTTRMVLLTNMAGKHTPEQMKEWTAQLQTVDNTAAQLRFTQAIKRERVIRRKQHQAAAPAPLNTTFNIPFGSFIEKLIG